MSSGASLQDAVFLSLLTVEAPKITLSIAGAAILIQIQQALGNVSLTNWRAGGDPCTNWQGVTCTNNNVSSL